MFIVSIQDVLSDLPKNNNYTIVRYYKKKEYKNCSGLEEIINKYIKNAYNVWFSKFIDSHTLTLTHQLLIHILSYPTFVFFLSVSARSRVRVWFRRLPLQTKLAAPRRSHSSQSLSPHSFCVWVRCVIVLAITATWHRSSRLRLFPGTSCQLKSTF